MSCRKRIAVTGGSGFLGTACIKLLKEHYDIISLGRKATETLNESIGHIEVRHMCTDYSVNELSEIFEHCSGVIHLASQKATPQNESGGLQAFFPSIAVAENVFKAAEIQGIKNVVVASSRCVYGTHTSNSFNELDETKPINYYGVSKVAVEQLALYYNETRDMNIKLLRFGQIVGGECKNVFSAFIDCVIQGRQLSIITEDIRDYIHVEDAANAIVCAVKHSDSLGLFNVSSGVGCAPIEIAMALQQVSNLDIDVAYANENNQQEPTRIVLDCTRAHDTFDWSCTYDTVLGIADALFHATVGESFSCRHT